MNQQLRYALPRPSKTVIAVMATLGVIFVAQLIVHTAVGFDLGRYSRLVLDPLALQPDRVLEGRVWQVLSYMFLHDVRGLGHIFFNLFSLYFFATPLEERFGRKRFLSTFVLCGLGGAVVILIIHGLAPLVFSGYSSPVIVGASGAVSGVVGAMCWLWRDRWLNLFIVRAKGWHLLVAFLVLELLTAMTGQPIRVAVHLGGMASGIAIAHGYDPYAVYQRWRLRRLRGRLRKITGGRDDRDLLN